jgi:hypothetical protein
LDSSNCSNCWDELKPEPVVHAAIASPASSNAQAPASFGEINPWVYAWMKDVERTKLGLGLILVGTLLGWIPIVALAGGILGLVGLVLLFTGRRSFGPVHSRNVVLSVGLLILGIIGSVALAVGFVMAITLVFRSGSPMNDLLLAFDAFVIGLILLIGITSLAAVLLSYDLQAESGRALLWTGYGVNLAVVVAAGVVFINSARDVVGAAYTERVVQQVVASSTTLEILSVFPSIIYAAAFYLAWRRIDQGEIPAPPPPLP